MGTAQDKAEDATKDGHEADASALKPRGDTIETQADIAADKLNDKAKAVRDGANKHTKALDQRAKSLVQ